MEILRKTSNDYRKELHKLKLDEMALEKRIRIRAEEMCKANPDVIIVKGLNGGNLTANDYYCKTTISIDTVLQVMEVIEEDLKAKEVYKQTTIQFPKTQHEKLMDIAKGIKKLNIPKTKK